LAISLTRLINEILLELFTVRLTNTVVTRAWIDYLFVAGSVTQLSKGVILKSAISAYSAIDRYQAWKGRGGGWH